VSYNPNGTGGGIGAGFTAGTGHYILVKRGAASVAELISDCTPPEVGTTLVAPVGAPNSCAPPEGTTMSPVKAMNDATYAITLADTTAGFLQFRFEYTNATVLNPNQQGQCIDRVGTTAEVNVFIAPPPTSTVNPPTDPVCAGSSASFTVTAAGSGPFRYSWSGPNGFASTNPTITIDNAQAVNAGVYTATVTDQFGCSGTSAGTLKLAPLFTSLRIAGSELILSGSGGTPNGAYTVLTTTNVATPMSRWVPIFTNSFDADGQFIFTNPINPVEGERYFRLRVP